MLPFQSTVEEAEVLFLPCFSWACRLPLLFFADLTDCSGLANEVYLGKTAGIQLREVFLYLCCNFMIHPVGKSCPSVVC